jgi:hypothetical protein
MNPRQFRELQLHRGHKEGQAPVGGCENKFEEVRVGIIDGTTPPGYFVHLGPDPDNVTARASTEEFVMPTDLVWLTRVNWMRRVPGTDDLLAPFREQYERHGEFMPAPVTTRKDGLLRFDLVLGVIKRKLTFRTLSEVHEENDPDALVLEAKQIISPTE